MTEPKPDCHLCTHNPLNHPLTDDTWKCFQQLDNENHDCPDYEKLGGRRTKQAQEGGKRVK